MSNIYKQKGSCDVANQDGAPDVLFPGDVVELKEDLPIQKLKAGQRAIVDKIYKGRILVMPFGRTIACMVKTKHVFKLPWGN